jgi:hypothetical protein
MHNLPANPMQPYIDAVKVISGGNEVCVSCAHNSDYPGLSDWNHWAIHIGGMCHVGRTFDEAFGKFSPTVEQLCNSTT